MLSLTLSREVLGLLPTPTGGGAIILTNKASFSLLCSPIKDGGDGLVQQHILLAFFVLFFSLLFGEAVMVGR